MIQSNLFEKKIERLPKKTAKPKKTKNTHSIESEDAVPKNATRISDLETDTSLDVVSFLDDAKKMRKCRIVSALGKCNCFWCRNPFDSMAIGCPIRYIPSSKTTTYKSDISKNIYTIKEYIVSNADSSQGAYYETDGAFCSFNCVMAFIKDNKHNPAYSLSESLLIKMYSEIMDTDTTVIIPAPSWRLLEEYGGMLSIAQFRSSFNSTEYECYGFAKAKSIQTGTLFEKTMRF